MWIVITFKSQQYGRVTAHIPFKAPQGWFGIPCERGRRDSGARITRDGSKPSDMLILVMELSKNRIKRTEFSIISIGHYFFFGREEELMIFGWIGLAVRVIRILTAALIAWTEYVSKL